MKPFAKECGAVFVVLTTFFVFVVAIDSSNVGYIIYWLNIMSFNFFFYIIKIKYIQLKVFLKRSLYNVIFHSS